MDKPEVEPSMNEDADLDAIGDVGGEDAGETAPPGDPFFVSKSAAAVLKHGILSRYLPPFVSKVGSTSSGHRVALLDGYAGPGRYKDGTAGSPALLAETARTVSAYRTVECHLVEQKRTSYKLLQSFLSGEGADLSATAYPGRVQTHLNTVLAASSGIPLFSYLDPFGFGVPFADVVRLLRRHPEPNGPATEVLLNFTANGIRRAGGFLKPGREITPSEEKTLQLGDAACGGDWWRVIVKSQTVLEKAVEGVAQEYMRRVCKASNMNGFALDVKNREHHKPVYYLIFFTRHLDGMWLFNESVSLASAKWREVLAPPPWEPDEDLLFDMPTAPSFGEEESTRATHWVAEIEANIERLIQAGDFVVGAKMTEVYGRTLGEAREMHVRRALKALRDAGKIESDAKGEIRTKRVIRQITNPT